MQGLKLLKQLLLWFLILFVIDSSIGFSLSYFASKIGHSTYSILVIDEVISFPLSLWNRLFPDYGVYRESSQLFWSILLINTLFQAIIFMGAQQLFKALKKKNFVTINGRNSF